MVKRELWWKMVGTVLNPESWNYPIGTSHQCMELLQLSTFKSKCALNYREVLFIILEI